MKIRYSLALLAACLLIIPGVMAQSSNGNIRKAKLKGIWQMCCYVSQSPESTAELKPSNTFKVLTDDGHITNFTYIPNKGAIITGQGTYEQVSDTVYNENIQRSIHLPMLNNKVNELHFSIEDNMYLHLKFYIEKDENDNVLDSWYYETWKRVSMPDKYPDNLVR